MAKHRTHRTHSIAFKRQVVQEYLAGETLHGLARRHDLSRTLIRIWVDKYEAANPESTEENDATRTLRAFWAKIEEAKKPDTMIRWDRCTCAEVKHRLDTGRPE